MKVSESYFIDSEKIFEMMENSRNTINKFAFPMLLVLLICGYVILLNISPINADYGYYVGGAKAIAHGLVPYRDINLGYSPFVFYLLSIPYVIGGEGISLLIPMYVSLFFYLANGYLIWKIYYGVFKVERDSVTLSAHEPEVYLILSLLGQFLLYNWRIFQY
mgnify:CR=1 FL=1